MNIAALCVAALAAAPASAQETDVAAGLAKCAVIRGNMERLFCYDAIARSLAPAPASTPSAPDVASPEGSGKWRVNVSKNPVDDSRTVVLGLVEDNGKAMLILRCMRGKPEVYINWPSYLGLDATPVLTRLGEAKADKRSWSLSTDHKGTFYPGNNGAFIKLLLTAERLVAQVTPYMKNPTTAVFDLRGLDAAIAPLRETCQIP